MHSARYFLMRLMRRLQRKVICSRLKSMVHTDIERIDRKLIEHDGKLALLQWMIGFNLAFTMAVLWKVFS